MANLLPGTVLQVYSLFRKMVTMPLREGKHCHQRDLSFWNYLVYSEHISCGVRTIDNDPFLD